MIPGLPQDFRALSELELARVGGSARRLTHRSADVLLHEPMAPRLRSALTELQVACGVALTMGAGWRTRAGKTARRGRSIVVDAACLQDPSYRGRGVEVHAVNVLTQVVAAGQGRDVVLMSDPVLPRLRPEIEALADATVSSAWHVDVDDVDLFVALSPMTGRVARSAPFLRAPEVPTVAVIYDFIPTEEPGRYLEDAYDRLDYWARLIALGLYDRGLAVSRATADRAVEILGWSSSRAEVTGVGDPLPAVPMERDRTGRPFVLAPSGGDLRKNLFTTVAAFCKAFGSDPAIDLTVVGEIPQEWTDPISVVLDRYGVDPGRVRIRSQVPPETLSALYRDAELAIVASRREGFSIPVTEAVRRRCPVVVSRIPEHVELVGDGWWAAGADDVEALADAAGRVRRDRAAAAEAQRATAGDVADPPAVSRRLRALLQDMLGPERRQRAIGSGRTPTLAVLSPLPPHRSGIADYTAATFHAVERSVDVTYVPTVRDPVAPGRRIGRSSCTDLLSGRFDRIVAVVGNSHFNIEAVEFLEHFGGAAIGHDTRMAEYYAAYRDPDEFARVIGLPTGTTERVFGSLDDLDSLPRSGYDDISRAASPLIVHSRRLAQRITAETGIPPVCVPFVPYNLSRLASLGAHDYRRARRVLGFDAHSYELVALGGIDIRTKAADRAIAALGWLCEWGHPARLHFVGECEHRERFRLTQIAEELGLADSVVFSGRVSRIEWRLYMLACDVSVQMRTSAVLSLSGALADAISFALPTVTSKPMMEDHEAPSFVEGLSVDATPVLMAEALERVMNLRRDGFPAVEAERIGYLRDHDVSVYVRGLLAALDLEPA